MSGPQVSGNTLLYDLLADLFIRVLLPQFGMFAPADYDLGRAGSRRKDETRSDEHGI
jgi:hypothetical protein